MCVGSQVGGKPTGARVLAMPINLRLVVSSGGLGTHSVIFSRGRRRALKHGVGCYRLRLGMWMFFCILSLLRDVSGTQPDLPSLPVPGADFGRFSGVPDAPSQLQTSSLEDLLCSHAPISSEDDASPGCATSSQVPFKAFLSPPELRAPRGTDRKLSPLLNPLQDPLADKTLLEPREMVRPKKVCFSESSLPSGDRTRRSYYLNGMAQAGVGTRVQ